MKAIGKKVNIVAREFTQHQLEQSTMENGLVENIMELELFNGLIAASTGVSGRIAGKMGRESL